MKKIFLFFVTLLIAGMSYAQQQTPAAWLNDDLSITLNTDLPVKAAFKADISHFESNLENEQAAERFLKNFERPFASIKVDFQTLKATISLVMNSETKNWTAERWNEYLKSN